LGVPQWGAGACRARHSAASASDCSSQWSYPPSWYGAAQIYRQGWAPEIWLFKDDPAGANEGIASLGIHHISEEEYDQQVFERLNVTKSAIRLLDPPAINTANGFELLREALH
jgi:hypothetical protein